MRRATRRRGLLGWFAAALLGLAIVLPPAASTAATAATAAVPKLTIDGPAELSAGSSIRVWLSGVPADTLVQFAQCNDRFDPSNATYGCVSANGPLPELRTNQFGSLTARMTLGDPLYLAQQQGDPLAVYCRGDQCRIFAVWTDSAGHVQSVASALLRFGGSPATITARPGSGLVDGERILVNGTAVGAYGRTVVVVEEACFAIIQETGCVDTVVLGQTSVRAHGRWELHVNVPRFLPGDVDCFDPGDYVFDATCQLTARVLTTQGQPDDTFGISRYGQPGALLAFLP